MNKSAVVLLALLTAGGNSARAGVVGADVVPFTISFDENGNSSYSVLNGAQNVNNPGFLQLDPNTGLPALTYRLPGPVVPGIFGILEPVSLAVSVTDVLSFYNTGSPSSMQGFMAYYSDNADGVGALADVPALPNAPPFAPPPSLLPITETGSEGSNGFSYNPFSSPDVHYNGISDGSVPEPATLTLLGIGALGMAGYGWRKRKAA